MRLIDAENLLEEYEQINWYRVSKEGQFMRGATTEDNPFIHYYDGEEIIKNAPTVDAVGVVRCRDCIHYDFGVCLKIYDDGAASSYAWQKRKPSDFCSYGERKEGADNG